MFMAKTAADIKKQDNGDSSTEDINIINKYYTTSQDSDKSFLLPPLIKTFVGREDEFEELSDLFFNEGKKLKIQNIVAVCGLPGTGKSEFAKQFAKKCQVEGKVHKAYWIDLETENDLEKSLATIYNKSKRKKCLIILNNAISRKSLAKYSLSDEHLFLITSEIKQWGRKIVSIQLEPLSIKFALNFYKIFLKQNYSHDYSSLYIKIAYCVECMPLGLQITAAYILEAKSKHDTKFLQAYVEELEQSKNKFLIKCLPESSALHYDKSLYGAIKMSLNKIAENNNKEIISDLALYVLCICCYLEPENIFVKHLTSILSNVEELKFKNYDKKPLRSVLALLANYSLINFDSYEKSIIIHRFNQNILRSHFSQNKPEIQYNCYKACLKYLLNYFVRSNEDYYDLKLGHFEHLPSILQFVDENLTIFIEFYEKYKANITSNSLLHLLITYGCIKSVKKILEDLTIDKRNKYYNELLYYAASQCDYNAIFFLIQERVQINTIDQEGNSPLFNFIRGARFHKNIDSNKINQFFFLLEIEKYKNIENNKGEILLHAAIDSRSVDLIELLIETYKINVNYRDKKGRTCLHKFVQEYCNKNTINNLEIAKLLIMHGTSLDIKDIEGRTPLEYNDYNETKYLRALVLHFGNCIKGYKNNLYLLHNAVILNNVYKLVNLIEHGINVDSEDDRKNTPLHLAAFEWNIDAMKVLIEHKASLNARNIDGITPLFYFLSSARYHKYVNINEIQEIFHLLKVKENKISKTNNIETFSQCAFASLHPELVELFVTKDNINFIDSQGNTPLHSFICQLKSLKGNNLNGEKLERIHIILQKFKSNGADLNIKNAAGMTPIELAKMNNLNEIEIYLLLENKYVEQLREVLNELVDSGYYINTLHLLNYSVLYNQLEVLKLLLRYDGIEVNHDTTINTTAYNGNYRIDKENTCTPLNIAVYEGNFEAVNLLIQDGKADPLVYSDTMYPSLFEYFQGTYHREHINLNEVNEISDLLGIEKLIASESNRLLQLAVRSLHDELIIFLFNKWQININGQFRGRTALHAFIEQIAHEDINDSKKLTRMRNIVAELMFRGASLDIKNDEDMTPIEFAQNKKVDHILIFLLFEDRYENHLRSIFEELLDDVIEYITKFDLLHCAIEQNQLIVLNLLLQYDIDINSKNVKEETPLHVATLNCNLEAIRILKKRPNAESSVRNSYGNIPLHNFFIGARSLENIDLDEVIEILLLLDCENYKNILNKKNESLMHAAAYSLHADLVDILRSKLDVNALDTQRNTPLHTLIASLSSINSRKEQDVIETVQTLQGLGARLDIKNENGMTPLKLAQQQKAEFIYPYLDD